MYVFPMPRTNRFCTFYFFPQMENIALVSVKVPYHEPVAHPKRQVFVPQANSTVSKAPTSEPSIGVKFLGAGIAACWADMVTFPLDTAKVRLQVGHVTVAGMCSEMVCAIWGSESMVKILRKFY